MQGAVDTKPHVQDNFFVHHVGAITMYGVCDGHGPFGHLVSFRLVQTIPHLAAVYGPRPLSNQSARSLNVVVGFRVALDYTS